MVQQQRIGDREIRTLWERWPWLAAATGAAVVMASGYYVIRAQSFSAASPSEAPIVVEPEITTITALGRLEPAGDVISLSAPSASERARVEKLLVKQGDRITVGQTIAILDTHPLLQAAVVEAERNVAIAQADLARVKAGAQTGDITAQTAEVERLRLEREDQIAAQSAALRRIKATRAGDIQAQQAVVDRIQAELDNAQADVKRYRTLKSEGAITVTELERFELTEKTARKRLQEAEAALTRTQSARQAEIDEAEANLSRIQLGQRQQIRSATATLDRITEVRPEDVQAAQAQVKAAEASVATAKLNAQQATVRSSQNGMVLKIHTRAGERLRPEGILDVGQTQTMTAIAEIYESDIGKVKLGQRAIVTSDVVEGELTGSVTDIGLQIQSQRVADTNPSANIDGRIVEVKVELDGPSSQRVNRLTNLQVEVKIQRQNKS